MVLMVWGSVIFGEPWSQWPRFLGRDYDWLGLTRTDLPSWNAELDCSLLTRLRLVTHFLCQQTDLEFFLQQKYFTSIYFISAKSFGNEKCLIKLIQRESITPTFGSKLTSWGVRPWTVVHQWRAFSLERYLN